MPSDKDICKGYSNDLSQGNIGAIEVVTLSLVKQGC